jgi:SET domain-containing protein
MLCPIRMKKKKVVPKTKKKAKAKRKNIIYSQKDFIIQPSSVPGIGMGLFTKQTLYKGDTVGYYMGRIITDEDAESPKYIDSKYLLWICKDWWIYGEGKDSNYTRYINHSDKPNAELITSVRWKTARFKVMKTIKEGEEIFFDYGKDYWDNVDFKPK